MSNSVIKQRLRRLAGQDSEELLRIALERRESAALPMAHYYRRDDALEARRARFYFMLAHEFGFEGWRFNHPGDYPPELVPGYGERKRDIQPIDQGRAVTINAASAPLEWLMARGRLASKQDTLEGIGMLRFNTALRMREEVEGAATAGLKGQAYAGGGGGGSYGRQPSDYAIDCMRMVSKVQESMHPDLYRLLIWVAVDDIWAWERAETPKEQHHVILKLHKAIDHAAVVLGYVTTDQFRWRWGRSPNRDRLDWFRKQPTPRAP